MQSKRSRAVVGVEGGLHRRCWSAESQKLNCAERCRAISLSSGRFSVRAPLLAQVAVLLCGWQLLLTRELLRDVAAAIATLDDVLLDAS